MTHYTVDYASLIRERGHRLTPQREMVLDALCGIEGHATADVVVERVQARSAAVDRSTVYRSLDFLTQLGLANTSEIDGTRVYELAIGQPAHHHLLCQRCGVQIDLDHRVFDRLLEDIRAATGFDVQADHLILPGVCAACRADS